MSLLGLSTLEMRQLIERACLPDRCEVSCSEDGHLTIRLGKGDSLEECVVLCDVPLDSLNSTRDVLELITQLRHQQHAPAKDARPRAFA
ncbi:DUF1652 domain-containing protein [Pseudomonas entomophila]|jgi:hypothetical protein|uniref:DUF1652 domain-containing protein n=1 Tax=Pseudomonas entomophila TaxID=312306 RepID=UPI0015E43030|nr:DUF1652 domain-containing protein [Pseudomonas entomophila]MBA1192246.1 DUF1652 domain-containing protein [Pseudomonas entomophila]